jgi:type II protein arginine methyltransferase
LISVAVLGAGRGPLIAAVLRASTATGVEVRITAIEKNKHAVVTLRNRIKSDNWTNVTLISIDMREWQPKDNDLVDIMVSELLGSWGDNELSPECLDGAEKCLKEGGISIPSDYTSFISPLSSLKIWSSARDTPKGLETPFVVKLHNFSPLADPLPLFRFEHPRLNTFGDNSRFGVVSFTIQECAIVHGFSGTFEATLYEDIKLSIMPSSHSEGLFSWFPLFIPLVKPVSVAEGDQVVLSVWRCIDDKRVWYEWSILSPVHMQIQNANGSSYSIGL